MNIKRMPTDEIVLRFLINKNKTSESDTVSLNVNDADSLKIPHEDIVRAFYNLRTDGYLTIVESSTNSDFSRYWTFKLTSKGRHYFEDKRNTKREKVKVWIQFLIPVLISIAALLKSYESEIISLWKLLKQLWR